MDTSGLKSNDTLEAYARKHNGRLPVNPIPNLTKPLNGPNKALKIFDKEK